MAGDFSKQRYLASMEGAVLGGQLAAKAIAEAALAQDLDPKFVPPRKLMERPKDLAAPDADETTPDRCMYSVRLGNVPEAVQEELNALAPAEVYK
jgi:hypothetical protein